MVGGSSLAALSRHYPARVCTSRGLCICLWTKKIFESYFSDQLTFSNIRSRTSRQIYRLAVPLRTPETLSSLSKLFNRDILMQSLFHGFYEFVATLKNRS